MLAHSKCSLFTYQMVKNKYIKITEITQILPLRLLPVWQKLILKASHIDSMYLNGIMPTFIVDSRMNYMVESKVDGIDRCRQYFKTNLVSIIC